MGKRERDCVCACLRQRYPCPKFNISFLFVSSLQSLYTFNRLATWGLEKSQFCIVCSFEFTQKQKEEKFIFSEPLRTDFRCLLRPQFSVCIRSSKMAFALSLHINQRINPCLQPLLVPEKKKEDSFQVFSEKKMLRLMKY